MVTYKNNKSRSKRRSYKSEKSLKAKILQVVNRQRETKVAVEEWSNSAVIKGINDQNDLQRIIPNIIQGMDSSQRVGNEITLKKLVVRGFYEVIFPVVSYSDTRIQLRQLILAQKGCSARNIIDKTADFAANQLLEPANDYQGDPNEYMTPVNKTAFSVRRDRRWTLKTGVTFGTGQSGQPQEGSKTYVYFTHTLTFGKGKKLHYKTSGQDQSEDFPYFLGDSVNQMGLNTQPDTSVLRTITASAYFFDS